MARAATTQRVSKATRVPVHLVRTYPVRWTEFAVLRDFLQNFYDAATPQRFHDGVSISREGDGVRVHMDGRGFALDWLLHMGASTKTTAEPGTTAGYFGEGFKIAALCAMRDYGWRVSMGSRDWSAEVAFSPELIDGVRVHMMVYDVAPANPWRGQTWLCLNGVDGRVYEHLRGAVRLSFCFPENPLFGAQLCAGRKASVWERSTTPLPAALPVRVGAPDTGLLFLGHQARATLPIPFVVAMPLSRDHARDRPALYDFQVVDALSEAAESMNSAAALRILTALSSHWNDPPARAYRCGRWSTVVRALVRRVSAASESTERFRKEFPDLLVAPPTARKDVAARNRRAAARAWANAQAGDVEFVQEAFGLLGYPTLEHACERAGGFPRPVALDGVFLRRVSLLESFVEAELAGLFAGIDRPKVTVMDASRSGWKGSAELFAERLPRWSPTGRRVRFRAAGVVLPESALSSNSPHEALATYVHERCHVFGGDAAAGFSAALTDALGMLAAAAPRMTAFEAAWRGVPLSCPSGNREAHVGEVCSQCADGCSTRPVVGLASGDEQPRPCCVGQRSRSR